MDWLGALFDTVTGGLPSGAIALCPEHLKRRWRERLADHNPFKTISANEDLVRATRLAWIEAAQDVLKEAKARSRLAEWTTDAPAIRAFDDTMQGLLLNARDHALDRRQHPGLSPIDAHVKAVIDGVPELVSPVDHAGIGASVTTGFTPTLAALSGWNAREIPAIYQQIAAAGLPTHGGGPNRSFGELVFAAFAELIKNPTKYPQAREAFHIAMDTLGRDIGQATLRAVQGLDGRLDALLERVDALDTLRSGFERYLGLLPGIAAQLASLDGRVEQVLQCLDNVPGRPFAGQLAQRMFRNRDAAVRDDAAISAFHYSLALDPFVGRSEAIRRIETDLLDDGLAATELPPFRWMALCGEGGTGKSRLAGEIVHRNRSVWVHAGFVESELLRAIEQVPAIGGYLQGPVFMVLDYAVAERGSVDLTRFLMAWADYAHGPGAHPVRVLVITRRERELLLEELRGKGISPNRDLSRVREVGSSPIVLRQLDERSALELMRTRICLTAEQTRTAPIDIADDALLAALDRFDDRRRPLFAAMVAAEIQRGTLPDSDDSLERNRLALFGQYLERQADVHWLPSARALGEADERRAVHRHANLVRLATCCGDVGVQAVRARVPEDVGRGLGLLPELSVAERPGAIRAALVAAMTGEALKDDPGADHDDFMPPHKLIPRLEPDLIGERFFLMTEDEVGATTGWSRAEALAGLSWACAPDSTAAFLRMAAQDYPERMYRLQWLPPRPGESELPVLRARAKMLRNVCSDIATRYGRTTIFAPDLERLFDLVDHFDGVLVSQAEIDAECCGHYGQVLRQVANIGARLASASTRFVDPIRAVEEGGSAPPQRSSFARAFASGGAREAGVAGRLDAEDGVQPLPPALAAIVVARLPPLLERAGRFMVRPGSYLDRQPFELAFRDVLASVHFRHRDDPKLGGRWPTPRGSESDAVLQDWRGRLGTLCNGDIDDITVAAALVSAFVYTDYQNSVGLYCDVYPAVRRMLQQVDRLHPAPGGRICAMLGNALVINEEADQLAPDQKAHIADSIGIYLRLADVVDLTQDPSAEQTKRVLGNFITTAFGVLGQGHKTGDARLGLAVAALERLIAMTPIDTPLGVDVLNVLTNLPEDLAPDLRQALLDTVERRVAAGAVDVDDFLAPTKEDQVYPMGQLIFGVPKPGLRLPDRLARALLETLRSKVGVRCVRAVLEAVPWTLAQPADVRAQVPLALARDFVEAQRQAQGFDARDYVSVAQLALWGHDLLNGQLDRVQHDIDLLWAATEEPAASRGRALAVWGVALVFDATRQPTAFTRDWAARLKDAELLDPDRDRQRLLGAGLGEREAEQYIVDYNLALIDACKAAAHLHVANGGKVSDWMEVRQS